MSKTSRLLHRFAIQCDPPLRKQSNSDLVRLDAEITSIQNTLESVIHEGNHVQHALESHKGIISRVRDIPPDIWIEIFQYCLPDEDYIQPHPLRAPLLLGQICDSWRMVALSMPCLWTSLSFRVQRPRHMWKAFLETWLTRSRTLSLSLEISWDPSMGISYFNDHVLKLITRSSKRWRSLRLSLPDDTLRNVLSNPLPLLQTLQLNLVVPLSTLSICPPAAPKLRSLSLLTIYQDPRCLFIPWQQLTHFHSQSCRSVPEYLQILRLCASLERCRLRVESYSSTPSEAPLLVPRLQSLTVIVGINEDSGPFLDSLVLPLLRDMELTIQISESSVSYHTHVWPKLQLLSLVSRSSCPLRRLCLKGTIPHNADLIDCVLDIPSLVDIVALYNGRNLVTNTVRDLLLRRA